METLKRTNEMFNNPTSSIHLGPFLAAHCIKMFSCVFVDDSRGRNFCRIFAEIRYEGLVLGTDGQFTKQKNRLLK